MMRKYDDEFKQNAVRKILDGQAVASVSREIGVAESLLHKWKKAKLETSSDLEKEVLELKKRLKEVEMERDILKKAALIFGRGS
jgi:transposase